MVSLPTASVDYHRIKRYSLIMLFVADAWLVISKAACDAGSSAVTSAKSCISNMAAGSQRSTLEGKLESLGGSLNPGFSDLNSGTIPPIPPQSSRAKYLI